MCWSYSPVWWALLLWKWPFKVKGLSVYNGDLFAVDCVYHQLGSLNFPREFCAANNSEKGRTTNEEKYFEYNHEEQIMLRDLISKMKEYLDGSIYKCGHLKINILEYYGGNIIHNIEWKR